MALRKSRIQATESNDQPTRRRGRPSKNVEAIDDGSEERDERVKAAGVEEDEEEDVDDAGDDDVNFADMPAISELRQANEPDPREVDDITERIFGSVLSRFGWERHGSRIEHVGEEAHQHHHRH